MSVATVLGGREPSEPERLLVVGIELQSTLESAQGARREPVARNPRFGFRPVRQERRLVAEQRVRPPVRDHCRIEAFEHGI